MVLINALANEGFAAATFCILLCDEKILERGVVNIPILADATAGDPPVPTKAGDVVASEVGGSSRLVCGNIAFTVEEDFITHNMSEWGECKSANDFEWDESEWGELRSTNGCELESELFVAIGRFVLCFSFVSIRIMRRG